MAKPGEAEKSGEAAPGQEAEVAPKPPEAKAAAKAAEEAKGKKGETQPAKVAPKDESAANKPVDWEAQFKALQKTHEATVGKLKEVEVKASASEKIGETVLEKMASLERRLDMRDGETIMTRVENLIDMGKQEAADELATRELSRRMAVLKIDPNDPLVSALKLAPPKLALHQFLTQEPSLLQRAASAPPKPIDTPPNGNGAASPAEERIGGKTAAEIRVEALKDAGVFKTIPDQPAGQTTVGFKPGAGSTASFAEAIKQYHDSQE